MSNKNTNSFMQDYLLLTAQNFPGYTRQDAELVLSILSVEELYVVAKILRNRALSVGGIRSDSRDREPEYPVPGVEYGRAVLCESVWLYLDRIQKGELAKYVSDSKRGIPAVPPSSVNLLDSMVHSVVVIVDRSIRHDEAFSVSIPKL